MSRGRTRVTRPPPVLAGLVARPGGLLRDVAIARSTERMETQRAPAQDAVLDFVAKLEAMTGSPANLRDMRRVTDQLIALAGIFGMTPLDAVGKRLCKLVAASPVDKARHHDAIALHVRALRLFAPPAKLSPQAAQATLAELDKVLHYFGIEPPAA